MWSCVFHIEPHASTSFHSKRIFEQTKGEKNRMRHYFLRLVMLNSHNFGKFFLVYFMSKTTWCAWWCMIFFLYKYAIYFHRIIFINIRMYSYQNRTLNIKYTNNSQLRQACALVWSIQITTDSNFVSDCVFVVVKLPMIIIVWWHAFRVNGNDKWLLWKRIELFYEFQTHRAHERIIYRLTNQIS